MSEFAITLTDAARERVRSLIAQKGAGARGLRIGVSTAGCNGMTYVMDFANEIAEDEAVVRQDGVEIVVPAKAQPYIDGTVIDWVEDRLDSKFTFANPNEAARCGCGESFTV